MSAATLARTTAPAPSTGFWHSYRGGHSEEIVYHDAARTFFEALSGKRLTLERYPMGASSTS